MSHRDYKSEIYKINGRYYVRAGWWRPLDKWFAPDCLGIGFVSDIDEAKGYWTLRGAERGARRWVRWMKKTDAHEERKRSYIKRAERVA